MCKKRLLFILPAIILSAALFFSACSRKQKPEESQIHSQTESNVTSGNAAETEDLIRDLVIYYGNYEHEADDRLNELLEKIEQADSEQGRLWKDIVSYWDYANSDLKVNIDRLPDDLPKDDSLCIAVLGYQLNKDGTMQDELISRLEVGLACANQYPNAYVVCTGGGTALNAPEATEGDRMGEWMLENGLEEDRLIIENRSMTTAQNAEFSYDILLEEYPQVDSVVIVSSSYHISWGSLLFEAAFMKSASEKKTPEIHVISNCACKITNSEYREDEILRWQTGGMLQLIGDNALAREYYSNTYKKPPLTR